MAEIFGFLNIHKEQGLTSHDVVAKVRRGLKIKKVGHAGTLDPMATGVLIVCIGGATRLSEYVMQSTKRYRARLKLGETTDTYDADGEVQITRDASHITRADVEAVLPKFQGDIQQIPPMYSAIKQGGRKLYDMARSGEVVEREPRAVRINALEIVDWSPPECTLDVTCSAGTYIRSLAYDLGEMLGVGAHLTGLIRSASGRFSLDDAISLDELLTADDWTRHLIPPQTALADWPTIHLSAEDADHITHGRPIQYINSMPQNPAFAYAPDGELIAIVQPDNGLLRPHKVFLSA